MGKKAMAMIMVKIRLTEGIDMAKKFGTDGIRGLANRGLTAKMVFEAAQAGTAVLTRGIERPFVLIGSDTRLSSDMFVMAAAAGICSMGADAIDLGVLPTPAVAILAQKYGASAGVMISASHNPYQDNGIKFIAGDGYKLPDHIEREIEEAMENIGSFELPIGADIGITQSSLTAKKDYINFLKNCLDDANLEGLTIALDCANGAAFEVAPDVFAQLGATLHVMGNSPNGVNINEKCGSTHIDALVNFMKEKGCDMGFSFDGDADRVFAVDERGNVLDGDAMMAILALHMKEQGTLAQNTVIATVMSNLGFINAMEKNGIKVQQTTVGDRYVLERMKAGGFTLGGEQSGHIILGNHQTTGDGLLAALTIAAIAKTSGKPLSGLNVVEKMPQILINAHVDNDMKEKALTQPLVVDAINALHAKYDGGKGRVLIRPSGTEALLRVMIEGENLEEITKDAEDLAKLLGEAK